MSICQDCEDKKEIIAGVVLLVVTMARTSFSATAGQNCLRDFIPDIKTAADHCIW